MGNKLFTTPPIVSSEPEITKEEIEELTYIGFTDEELKELGYIVSNAQEEIEALRKEIAEERAYYEGVMKQI